MSRIPGSGGSSSRSKGKSRIASATSMAAPSDKSFKDQALRTGGGMLMGALKVLDAPRAAVDKLNELGPRQKLPGVGDVSAGNWVPIAGQVAMLSKLRDKNPKGIPGFLRNTAVDIAQDPLTYISFGAGSGAKAGLKVIAKELGPDVAEEVVERGAKRALTPAMRSQVTARLVADGVKPKQAEKLLKAVDRGGQGGVKVLGRTLVPEKNLPVAGSASRAVRRAAAGGRLRTAATAVTPRAGISLDLGKDVADEVGAAAARSRAWSHTATGETVERFVDAMKAAKVTRRELEDIVLPAVDVGGAAVPVPARLQPLVSELRVERDALQRALIDEGLLHAPDGRNLDEYVPLKLTRAGRKALEVDPSTTERVAGYSTDWTASSAAGTQGGHLKTRDVMPGESIQEVERVLGGALKSSGSLAPNKALTVRDPVRLFAERSAQGHRSLAYKRFVDEVADIDLPGVGKLMQPVSGGTRQAGWVQVNLGSFGDFYAPKAVAKEVDAVRDVIVNDKAIKEFQQLVEQTNAWWKSMATIGSIVSGGGFFARNAIGNLWNNFLAGVKNPADYAKAAELMGRVKAGRALSAADQRLWDEATKHGVLGSGFYVSEVTRPFNTGADFAGKLGRAVTPEGGLQRAAKAGRAANVFSRESLPLRAGSTLSGAIEDHARLSHFVAKMRQHGDPDEAAASVRKYLFDYQDLTAMDRHIKHIAAFWTWTRKNTALQMQALLSQPGKFTGFAHVMLNAAAAGEPGEYPQWAVDQGLVPVGDNGLMVGVDAPPGAAAEALDPSAKNLIGMMGGLGGSLGKTAFEQATGHSSFTGSPVDTSAGGTAKRTLEAAVPLVGRIERSPYVAELTDDPQARARRLSALGLQARVVDEGGGESKKGKKRKSRIP